ncbi:WhiB family transcriptional regulator [Streptomyces sp. NPDC057413]|uniref:WhiB family transcriptional regulator n=1 Tax=Streptomyces sp. NPDC057413 TaxID=3346124 RepID=UPI00368904B3
MESALCAQVGPGPFHAETKGASYAEARKVCAACPVQDACAAHAQRFEGDLSSGHRHGMWGKQGPTARARAAKEAA